MDFATRSGVFKRPSLSGFSPISESTDGSLGFEGMAIVNGTVWLSRIDDNSVYTVTDILE